MYLGYDCNAERHTLGLDQLSLVSGNYVLSWPGEQVQQVPGQASASFNPSLI